MRASFWQKVFLNGLFFAVNGGFLTVTAQIKVPEVTVKQWLVGGAQRSQQGNGVKYTVKILLPKKGTVTIDSLSLQTKTLPLKQSGTSKDTVLYSAMEVGALPRSAKPRIIKVFYRFQEEGKTEIKRKEIEVSKIRQIPMFAHE